MEQLIKLIQLLIGRATYDNSIDIDVSVEDYENQDGFFIIVGTEGVVHALTFGGQEVSRVMNGPIPIRFKKIFKSQTTATNISVNW